MIVTDSYYSSSLSDDLIPSYLLDVKSQINETLTKFRTYFNRPPENVEYSMFGVDVQYRVGESVNLGQIHIENAEATSEKLALPSQVLQEIRGIISLGHNTIFEDGIDSDFYTSLDTVVRDYGIVALNCLQEQIAIPLLNTEISAEILRYLGEMQHIPSYGLRLQMLIHALQHKSAKVRDGASLGLASLDDPNAIPALKNSIRRERIPDLREDMQLVLEQLEEL